MMNQRPSFTAWSRQTLNALLGLAGVRLIRTAALRTLQSTVAETVAQRNAALAEKTRAESVLAEATGQRDAAIAEKATVLRWVNEARAERDDALVENLKLLMRGEQNVDGHTMIGNPKDAGLSIAGIARVPPTPEAIYFRQAVKPGQTVLDIGANVGLFTLQFARQVGPGGMVYAFEPGPISFGLLQANVALNHYRNVVLEYAAVTSFSGETQLLVCRTAESDNRIAGYADPDDRDAMAIKCFALDDYFDKGRKIDFVKLDIQGAEIAALSGMQRIVSENPAIVIALEFVLQGASPVEDLFGYAERLGFRVFQLLEDGSLVQRSADWVKSNIEYANLVLQRADH